MASELSFDSTLHLTSQRAETASAISAGTIADSTGAHLDYCTMQEPIYLLQISSLGVGGKQSSKSATFDGALNEFATQADVFEACGVRDLLAAALLGYTLFSRLLFVLFVCCYGSRFTCRVVFFVYLFCFLYVRVCACVCLLFLIYAWY